MGAGYAGPPNQYPAGLDFDYSVWSPGTRVDLVNVAWDNNYRDVVRFANKDTLNSYINNKTSAGITVQNMTYAKPGEDIYLGIPYNRVNRYNYLRASNPLMPIEGDIQKDFYYFILECEFVNPTTTRLRLQLDVFQTYVYDATFGNCYVERGHIGIANSNGFNNYGRDYLTVPEGLDVGREMRVISKRTEEIMAAGGALDPECDVLVVSTIDLAADPGTKQNPNQKIGQSSQVNGMPSAATFYLFESFMDFSSWADSMRDYPWVMQGIISVTAVPKASRYNLEFLYDEAPNTVNISPRPIKYSLFDNWRESSEIRDWLGSRYQHLDKFLTFPYMAIEMTAWSATPLILKPESWNNSDALIMERCVYMLPNQRVQFIPRQYNSSGQTPEAYYGMTQQELIDLANSLPLTQPEKDALIARYSNLGDDFGDYLDVMTQIADFPSLPVVNNMAINYLASNAHGIQYQRESADWAQQRALAGAQAGYDVASGAINTARQLTGIGTGADIAQTGNQNRTLAAQAAVSAIGQGVAGVGTALTPAGAGGAAIAGLSNAAVTGINAGIQTQSNDESLGIRNKQAWDSTYAQNRQAALSRDTNVDLARFAARGDYANTIAGINAKVQDANLIPPSIVGQFGGDAANIAFGTLELSLRWKFIDDASKRIIGEFWLRYGYAIRAFIQLPQTLMVMSKFTYWKTSETYIAASNIPESHKGVLRGIIEKGVTVWANPDDIGQIDIADNVPLGGISY